MKTDRRFYLTYLLVYSFIFLIGGQAVQAAQFSADVIQHIGAKSKKGKIYVKDSSYRMEVKESGMKIVIIVDQKAGVTRVIAPAEKKYKEMKSTDMGSLVNDPIQAAKFSATTYQQKSLGLESIGGFECDKSALYHKNQLLVTQWISKKLMFHLKIVTHGTYGRTMELKNIHEGPVKDALFQVPTGYARMEDPQKRRKKERANLSVVTTTVKGELPWARRIGQGGEIRVKIAPHKLAAGEIGRSIRFKVKNLIKGESVFTIKAFRGGEPIKIDIEETYSLRGRVKPLLGLQNKAEEVAVKVEKGSVIAEIMAEDSPFAKDKTKSFFIMTGVQDHQQGLFADSKRPLRLSITSDSQDAPESKVKVKFYQGDHKNMIDEAEVVLKNGQTKIWEYPAAKGIETLDIVVAKKGGVKVKLDQRKPLKLTKDTKSQINLAIQNNDQDKVNAFLDRGLDVNASLQGDGTNALMRASNMADAEMVKMLLARGADINYTNKYGWTALLKALDNRKHWAAITPVLIKSGADVNATLKSNGYTPLWKAIGKVGKNRDAAIGIIKLLLLEGANANAPYISKNARYSGETPLMSASKRGYTDVVKLLLSHGADVNTKSKAGKTALDYAKAKGHREIVGLLTTKGKAPAAKAKPQPAASRDKKEISGEKIPPYKGANITQSLTDGNRTSIVMESTASPEEIMTFYKTEMAGKGWNVKLAKATGRSASLMMLKGTQAFILSASQRKGKTKIIIRLSNN